MGSVNIIGPCLLGQKRFLKKSRKVKKGQYGQKCSTWSKLDKNWSKSFKTVKNGQKR